LLHIVSQVGLNCCPRNQTCHLVCKSDRNVVCLPSFSKYQFYPLDDAT
jgi:hypothetical protein